MRLLQLTGRRVMAGTAVDQPHALIVSVESIVMAMPQTDGSLIYTTGPTLSVTASLEDIAAMIEAGESG